MIVRKDRKIFTYYVSEWVKASGMKKWMEKPALISHEDAHIIPIEILMEIMQDILARGAEFRFRARGWSMSPFIRDGDVITISPRNKKKPAVGKVVAFLQPDSGRLVVHRIIKQSEDNVPDPGG